MESEAWFDKAIFRRDCRFTGVRFLGDALYQNSQFLGNAWFNNVEVFKTINFDEAHFDKDIMLAASYFRRNLSLTAAQVKTAEEIGPMIVDDMFILDQASFYSSISIRATAPRVSCTATKFLEGAIIDVTCADVLLNRALFDKSSSVVGNALDGAPGTTTSRLLSMYGVDASNLALINLNLAPCRFSGTHNLDKMRIEATRPFADSPAACRIRVGNRTIPLWRRWTRRQTLAEEHDWRYSNSSARTSRFARFNRIAACPEWNPRECNFPEWATQWVGRPPLTLAPEDLAPLYRSLRKAQEDSKNEPGAADFYYGEMEMRRRSSATPLSERFILHLYWLSSGYALRASRAVALLLGIIILNGFLCYFIGLPGTRGSSIISSTVYVVETALSLPTEQLQLSTPIRILRIMLRLTVPLLVGLTILCVRNRIKR
ncbi:MAG: pentapeptide repeat-containing protein [Pseudonocardiaceae bacterium]